MSDQELLSAISDIVEAKLEPIKQDIRGLREDVSVLKEKVGNLEEDVSILKEKVSNLEEDVSILKEKVGGLEEKVGSLISRMDSLESRMGSLESRMDSLESRMDLLESRMDSLESRMGSLEKEVRRNSILLENEVLPRVQTIEKMYVGSSRNFMEKVAQIDSMQNDIDVMKVVIQEHSEKLEKIS